MFVLQLGHQTKLLNINHHVSLSILAPVSADISIIVQSIAVLKCSHTEQPACLQISLVYIFSH